jgi:hypothetical protein
MLQECQTRDFAPGGGFSAANMQALLGSVDFVGLSAYPRFKGKLEEMEDSTQMFDRELKVG